MNKVILMGRLTRDPEVRYTQTGKVAASFTLAVNRRRSANKENIADFIPIIAWEKLGEICGNYLVKGSQVLVEGRIQVRQYEAKDGSKRYITEVIAQEIEFAGSKHKDNASASSSSAPLPPEAASFGTEVPPDEEIPF